MNKPTNNFDRANHNLGIFTPEGALVSTILREERETTERLQERALAAKDAWEAARPEAPALRIGYVAPSGTRVVNY